MGEIINWMGGWPKEGLLAAADWESRLAEADAPAESSGRGKAGPAETARLRELLAEAGLLRLSAPEAAGTTEADGTTGGTGAGRAAGGAASAASAGAAASRQPEFVVAAGADAALERVARLWLQPGDAVLVESPTSRSALQTFRKAGVVPHPVAGDRYGMLPEELDHSLAQLQPRLVYAAPACTDPEGRSWSEERRNALLRRCAEAGVPALLDDRQAALLPEPYPAVPEELLEAGSVWTIGELPPGLIGGLRFGWLALGGLPAEGSESLLEGRGAAAGVPLREQLAVLSWMEDGELGPLLETLRFVCRARNGLLAEQLRLRLPDLSWREPQGGMHLWLSLPEGLDGDALLRGAWLNGLLFQPGGAFYAAEPERGTIRLTAVHSEEKTIRAGVERLAATVEEFLARWG
ncbi:hypothetical protein J19TS2_41810 [Cohnella xylanilytica]|uniref:aminotransferase class I/II-fold pyridoxal phosphate-dependent enzyme n=1 Tax=Cohnella xylanilytica TaxID=557555 RepID=UPI001B14ABEE|nr:PLP-dependent aminotransferase family protein [Cohnella xylanilytica]GIO14626.1 hypothetical protein J19TS2_41810 [Cohnella xylanilytica]